MEQLYKKEKQTKTHSIPKIQLNLASFQQPCAKNWCFVGPSTCQQQGVVSQLFAANNLVKASVLYGISTALEIITSRKYCLYIGLFFFLFVWEISRGNFAFNKFADYQVCSCAEAWESTPDTCLIAMDSNVLFCILKSPASFLPSTETSSAQNLSSPGCWTLADVFELDKSLVDTSVFFFVCF